MSRKAKQYGCVHPEAYCLMRYRDDVTGEIEVIWNSQDEVTPFGLRSRSGNDSVHVDWQLDEFSPDHRPNIGDRVFARITVDRAKELAGKWYDFYAKQTEFIERFPNREQAILEHALTRMADACPDIVVVDAGLLERLSPPPFVQLYRKQQALLEGLKFGGMQSE